MTKETYEIVIENLAQELQIERWRRKETEKELEAVRKEIAKMINDLKGEKENA